MKIDDTCKLLYKLEQLGLVESWYEMRCGYCRKMLGRARRFNEFPENFKCEVCGNIMSKLQSQRTLDNTIKIYKVLCDEKQSANVASQPL